MEMLKGSKQEWFIEPWHLLKLALVTLQEETFIVLLQLQLKLTGQIAVLLQLVVSDLQLEKTQDWEILIYRVPYYNSNLIYNIQHNKTGIFQLLWNLSKKVYLMMNRLPAF